MRKNLMIAAAAMAAAFTTAANADVSFTQEDPTVFGIRYTLAGGTGSLSQINSAGAGGLLVSLVLNSSSTVEALFKLTGSTNTPALLSPAGVYEQDGINNGTFSFTGVGSSAGTNYLSGTYENATITGKGNAGSEFDTANVVYTGGVLAGTPAGSGNFSITLNTVKPPFSAVPGQPLNSFRAVSTGSFSAGASGVPEMSVWGMLVVGFAGIGTVVRRRGLKLPGRRLAIESL